MSATNRGSQRVPQDAYATPSEAIDALLPWLYIPHLSTFLEPCRGTGAIYDRIRCHRKLHCEIAEGADYLAWATTVKVNFIITNPPFSLALEFLQKSLGEAETVIYLLRLNFLGSQKRREFWQAHRPTHVLALAQRPCFTGDGKTDATDYAWFCWDRGGYVQAAPGVHVL